jgi:hypothetical protein
VRKSLVTPQPLSRGWGRSRLEDYRLSLADLCRLPTVAFTRHPEEEAMARRRRQPARVVAPPVVHPDAAGIDLGATEIYVCVPLDRDPQPIRCFGTFTEDLHAPGRLAAAVPGDGRGDGGHRRVLDSLYRILETRGVSVCL